MRVICTTICGFNSCDLPNLDGHTTVNSDLLGRITTGGANVENLDAYDCRNVAVGIQSWRDSNSAGYAPAGTRQTSKIAVHPIAKSRREAKSPAEANAELVTPSSKTT